MRRVTVREARGNAGYVANALVLQLVEGRLYARTPLDVWRVDGGALRAGRLGPPFAGLEDFGPTGWSISQLTVLADCQGAGRDAVLRRAYREGRAERCGFGGGDVHAPRQFGLWAVTPTTRLLVRSERAEDAVLGCNS